MCIEHGAADNEVDHVGVDEVRSIGLELPHSLGAPGGGERIAGWMLGWLG